MKRPSFMFYPGDWQRDTGLQSCSLAARGLWIEMVCIMHDGDPYGYLRAGNKDILPPILARMVGVSLSEAEGCLKELEDATVFSRSGNGVIFSRRMVKDEELRQLRAAGGVKSQNHPNVPKKKDIHTPILKGIHTPTLPTAYADEDANTLKEGVKGEREIPESMLAFMAEQLRDRPGVTHPEGLARHKAKDKKNRPAKVDMKLLWQFCTAGRVKSVAGKPVKVPVTYNEQELCFDGLKIPRSKITFDAIELQEAAQ